MLGTNGRWLGTRYFIRQFGKNRSGSRKKDELKALLAPYVVSSNDVIGPHNLNTYLREFREIEQKQFKLWFSSVSLLNTILNNAIEGRTMLYLEKIKSKIRLYVVTKSLDKANELLDKKNYC